MQPTLFIIKTIVPLENTAALKLINRMQSSIIKGDAEMTQLAEDFRKLREYALEEALPRLVKTCRLSFQHIEENKQFLIPIPSDEPVDEDHEIIVDVADLDGDNAAQMDSINYLLSLMIDSTNKQNADELKEYIDMFEKF